MSFEFATATRIVFAEGAVRQIAPAVQQFCRRALMVTGRTRERSRRLCEELSASGVCSSPFDVPGEPTIDLVRRGVDFARQEQCEAVIALGGGSVMDAGKAIAALLTNPGELLDYVEVVGKGNPLPNPGVPFVSVPTTAGTGTEVTRNAVLGVPEKKFKVSLRSPFLLARLAVVDPELTLGLPPEVTARTGLDALTQLIEPYVSIRANAMVDGFCRQGIPLVGGSLRRAFHHPGDRAARRDMSLAALFSGLSLANAGLGVVHGFAAPLGGRFPAPHGAVCAAILPNGMEVNLRALRARAPASDTLDRYQDVGRLLTAKPDATAEDGIAWVRDTCQELEIPPLRAYGIGAADVPSLVAEAAKASSMKANPLPLTAEELAEVLRKSM
jgi:alcohol dehydrogenase class IV